jgi:HAD superfamily hydrolase (TIGR01549 family)
VIPNSNVRAVLFDWDGTLVDTADASFRCYVRTFADYGIRFDRTTYADTYSPDWHHTYRCVQLAEERWTEADAKWLGYFREETATLIEGAVDALDLLASHSIVRGLVTSATRSRIERETVALGVDHHFSHAVCGDDGPRRKPHPEALLVCLDRLKIEPQEAVYIGDTPQDVMMAKAAGVFAIAVPGPYPIGEALRASEPDLLASSLKDAMQRMLSVPSPAAAGEGGRRPGEG